MVQPATFAARNDIVRVVCVDLITLIPALACISWSDRGITRVIASNHSKSAWNYLGWSKLIIDHDVGGF